VGPITAAPDGHISLLHSAEIPKVSLELDHPLCATSGAFAGSIAVSRSVGVLVVQRPQYRGYIDSLQNAG
jgi:hypothetical protein